MASEIASPLPMSTRCSAMVPALERAVSKPTTSGAVPFVGVAARRADGAARAGDATSDERGEQNGAHHRRHLNPSAATM